MTIIDQINQLGASAKEDIQEGFQGVDRLIQHKGEMDLKKSNFLRDRLESINNIKKELGLINREHVQELSEQLKKEIKGGVIKDRKIGKMNFGRSIDMQSLGSYGDKIDELATMAMNTKVADQLVKDMNDRIDGSTLMTNTQKSQAKQDAYRVIADPDLLKSLSPADLTQQVAGIIKDKSDINLVVTDILGEVGTESKRITDKYGETYDKTHSSLLDMDDRGNLSFSEEGAKEFELAFSQAKKMGYTGTLEEAKRKHIMEDDSRFGHKDRAWEDPEVRRGRKLMNDARELSNKKTAKGLSMKKGISIDVLSDYIMRPDGYRDRGFSDNLDKFLLNHDLDFERLKGNKIYFAGRGDKTAGGERYKTTGKTFDLSKPEDQAAVRNILEDKITDENILDLDMTEDDVHGGFIFDNIQKGMSGWSPDKGAIKVITDKGVMIKNPDGKFYNMSGEEEKNVTVKEEKGEINWEMDPSTGEWVEATKGTGGAY